ncbi:MAG: AAA family ATPase, partial [Myxococcota bacterium]
SAMEWAARRDAMHEEGDGLVLFPVISLAVPHLHKELPALASKYDCVIIDGSPRVDAVTTSVIIASDLVLMPIKPSSLDVWASDDVIELIEKARPMKEGLGDPLAAAFVINMRKSKTVVAEKVSQAMQEHRLPLLATQVGDRTEFINALASGRTVAETAPKGPAAGEINQLTNDIMEYFDEQGRLIQSDAT